MMASHFQRGARIGLIVAMASSGLLACKNASGPSEDVRSTGSEFTDNQPQEEAPSQKNLGNATVYFGYDESSVNGNARTVLEQLAQTILAKDAQITIEGHCDDRGSDEYNLALGERRALAVQRYLTDLGVASGKMNTQSFGESRPAVAGANEEAWSLNRRAEIILDR